jgi:predicted anti-sigma-YlaC factor YlaD
VAGTLSAWAIDPFDLSLGMRLPLLTALINRAYELDPGFNAGALDEFFVLFHAAVPSGLGGDLSRVPLHYTRALERSGGHSAGLHVAMAQNICIPAQDYQAFRDHLNAALAVDVDADPSTRLVNIINQRKARWLLARAPYYFLEAEDDSQFF